MALKFYTSVAKGLKLKVRRSYSGKTGKGGGLFVLLSPPYWIGLNKSSENPETWSGVHYSEHLATNAFGKPTASPSGITLCFAGSIKKSTIMWGTFCSFQYFY